MPYADPEKKREHDRKWRKEAIASGYGKALYKRRALRYKNEETLRAAMQDILDICVGWSRTMPSKERLQTIHQIAEKALNDSPPPGPPSEYVE